jgi:hypothetical protein
VQGLEILGLDFDGIRIFKALTTWDYSGLWELRFFFILPNSVASPGVGYLRSRRGVNCPVHPVLMAVPSF